LVVEDRKVLKGIVPKTKTAIIHVKPNRISNCNTFAIDFQRSVLHTKLSYDFRKLGTLCNGNMEHFYDCL